MVQDLLEGASIVLAERGPSGFTTNHVAQATGASIGSLYQYYADKSAVLGALHDRDAERLWEQLEPILADRGRSLRDRLAEALRVAFQVQAEATALHAALEQVDASAHELPGDPDLRARIVARLAAIVEEAVPERAPQSASLAEQAVLVVESILVRLARDRTLAPEVDRIAERTAERLTRFFEIEG